MNLETNKTLVNKSQRAFFEFLSDLKNFEILMPENTTKFEVDGESSLFSLKGMPEIRLVIAEKTPYNKIILGAASSKLNFSLTALIDAVSENSCETQLQFEGDFNPMMAMMIKGPLQKFIDTLTTNAAKL